MSYFRTLKINTFYFESITTIYRLRKYDKYVQGYLHSKKHVYFMTKLNSRKFYRIQRYQT